MEALKVLTQSTAVELGSPAPSFALPDTEGKVWKLDDFDGFSALVVVFMCNHCPYVKHLKQALAGFAIEMAGGNAALVAISSNDAAAYPADAPEKMAEDAETFGYTFPYLYDASQEVAKAYGAVCTPDFYVFDGNRRLTYRGQFDDSRPGSDRPVTGADLSAAVDAALAGRKPLPDQRPSVGCSIKWKTA